MSDIGILNDPLGLIGIALLLSSPGFLLGVLLWRSHRVAGALLGAVVGIIIWLSGWMVLNDVI